jgi:hypothetical protein
MLRWLTCLAFGILVGGSAAAMTITVYHDGEACPGGCDAHVVFAGQHNGTAAASDPASSRTAPAPCIRGQPCRICFAQSDASCLVTTYRGSGPPPNRFDVTPAFLAQHCPIATSPAQLRSFCAGLEASAAPLAGRVYCVATPDHPGCAAVIMRARAAFNDDRPRFEQCRAMGEAAFNATQPAARRRSNNCTYERTGTGQNSNGVTWRRLLPGACPAPGFVGRDGLDCCQPDLVASRAFGRYECAGFLLPP